MNTPTMADPGEELRRRMAEIVARHGPWTAHSIDLGQGVRTFAERRNSKLFCTGQFLRMIAGKQLHELRVLDLGCLEGAYAIELALQGAQVVGVEVRAANIAKARFAKDALHLTNIEFLQDDVRNISPERHGVFDVVICAGLLYHLDAPDLLPFLERCGEMCRGHLLLDTQIALHAREKFRHRGRWYHGYAFREFAPETSVRTMDDHAWAAHKNHVSFVLTKRSLTAALVHAGFEAIAEGLYPYAGFPYQDYAFMIAGKAAPMTWRTSPELGAIRQPPQHEKDEAPPQNPYLKDNTVAHPARDFVVPSELRDTHPDTDLHTRFSSFRFHSPLKPQLDLARIRQLKIDLAAGIGRASSIRDFGGLWGVDGLYLLEGARILRCGFAEMVDISPSSQFDEKAASLRKAMDVEIKMTCGDFRQPQLFASMRAIEVSLLYEVLLHQDNAVEVIRNVTATTTHSICIAQPVLKEELFALPNGTVNLQFYPEELKDQLRYSGWWEKEPACDRFSPQFWMWGQTASYLISVLHGYGWRTAHAETFHASEYWNYAMLRFTK